MIRACWRGVTAKAASFRLVRAFTSTKATRFAPCGDDGERATGVRKRFARIR